MDWLVDNLTMHFVTTQGSIVGERQEILTELVEMKGNMAPLPDSITNLITSWPAQEL